MPNTSRIESVKGIGKGKHFTGEEFKGLVVRVKAIRITSTAPTGLPTKNWYTFQGFFKDFSALTPENFPRLSLFLFSVAVKLLKHANSRKHTCQKQTDVYQLRIVCNNFHFHAQ